MTFSEVIFQKDLYKITREDLEKFFSEPQEETSILEFKEGNADLKKIHSEIAAFLNTEGGLLIYGAPREIENPNKKGYKQAYGPLTPCTVRDRDVIMRSIGSGIAPAPTTVKIHSVEIEGGAVYLLEIGQSMHPPHQATDSGKYYIRLEREAKAAPHGIVEALFFRRQKPKLYLNVSTETFDDDESSNEVALTLEINNDSIITAESIGYLISVIGAREINEGRSYPDFTWEDGVARCNHFSPNDILVKGVSRIVKFRLKMEAMQMMINVSYYCKDGELLTDYYIIERNGKILDSLLAIKPNTEDVQNFIDKYTEYTRAAYSKIISFSDGTGVHPLDDPYSIYSFDKKLKSNLPHSYLSLFSFMDGFEGTIGGTKVQIYSFNKFLEVNENGPIGKYLEIGRADLIHGIAILSFNDNKIPKFGMLWDHAGRPGQFSFEQCAYTMYDLLLKIYNGEIPKLLPVNKTR